MITISQFKAGLRSEATASIVNKYVFQPVAKGFSSSTAPYLLILIATAIGVVVFWDYLIFEKLYLFTGQAHDTVTFELPRLLHFSQYIRTDGIPFWSFSQGLGQDVFPFSLGNVFRSVLFLLNGDHAPYGIAYVELLKVILAALFFYSYLRCLELTAYVAFIGGLLYAFSSFMILGGTLGLFSTQAVFCSLLLLAFERLYRWNRYLLFPIAIALIAAHQPFDLYIFGVFLLTYITFRCAYATEGQTRTYLFLCAKVFGLTLLGIGITCVFTSGMVLHMVQSGRGSGLTGVFNGLTFGKIFNPATTIDLFASFTRLFSTDLIVSEPSITDWAQYHQAPMIYTGLITLLLAPQVFASSGRKAITCCLPFLLLWTLPVVFPFIRLSLWLHTDAYHRLSSFFLGLILLIFGLIAFSKTGQAQRLKIPLLLVTCGSLLLALCIAGCTPFSALFVPSSLYEVSIFLITYTILLCLVHIEGIQTYVKLALLFVVCVELALFSRITLEKNPGTALTPEDLKSSTVGYYDYSLEAVAYLKTLDKSFFRITKDYSSNPEPTLRIRSQVPYNDPMAQGYYGTSAYTNFNQSYYIRFLTEMTSGSRQVVRQQWLEGFGNSPSLCTLTSAKYHLSKGQLTDAPSGDYELLSTFGDVHVFKRHGSLPLGFTYGKYMTLQDLRRLQPVERHYALLNAFVIDERQKTTFQDFVEYSLSSPSDQAKLPGETPVTGGQDQSVLALTHHSHNRIKGTISLKEKRLLFFSIPFDKGWLAKVDGQETKLELTNIGFMGIILGPGNHVVELRFTPVYFWPGLAVSLFSLFGYAMMALYSFRKDRAEGSPAATAT
jgi:uncharacterized membrane protein YfhO